MKSILRGILNFLEVYLPAAIFCVLILSVFVQVVFRYIFDQPIPQLFEISIYSFIWVIYLGGALATRYNQHMRFDLIYRKLSRSGRYIVDVFFDTLLNVIILVIISPTISTVIQMYKLKSDTLGIPWSYLLVCFPIFLILIFIHNTISIVQKILEISGAARPAEETPPWL